MNESGKLFQFHEVQLKELSGERSKRDDLFQFHEVQLKASKLQKITF